MNQIKQIANTISNSTSSLSSIIASLDNIKTLDNDTKIQMLLTMQSLSKPSLKTLAKATINHISEYAQKELGRRIASLNV